MAREKIEQPLRNLRKQAGISLEDMAAILSKKAGRCISPEYVRLLESRGTEKYIYISAYADATHKHISLVADAAKTPENSLSN